MCSGSERSGRSRSDHRRAYPPRTGQASIGLSVLPFAQAEGWGLARMQHRHRMGSARIRRRADGLLRQRPYGGISQRRHSRTASPVTRREGSPDSAAPPRLRSAHRYSAPDAERVDRAVRAYRAPACKADRSGLDFGAGRHRRAYQDGGVERCNGCAAGKVWLVGSRGRRRPRRDCRNTRASDLSGTIGTAVESVFAKPDRQARLGRSAASVQSRNRRCDRLARDVARRRAQNRWR